MEPLTFDQLPAYITDLGRKVDAMLAAMKPVTTQLETPETPISIQEASLVTGYTVATIYAKACKRKIPVYKKGNKLFFYKSELLKWINAGKVKSDLEINAAVDAAILSHSK